jgi:DNA-damage-inducible protein J
MAMATSSYTHRIDPELRAQSEAIYAALGMPLGTAINVFLRKSVAVGGFPFDVRLDVPARETVEAMLEAERIANDPKIEALSVEDALEELKK